MMNPDDPITRLQKENAEAAAPALGVQLRFIEVPGEHDLEHAFDTAVLWHASALLRPQTRS